MTVSTAPTAAAVALTASQAGRDPRTSSRFAGQLASQPLNAGPRTDGRWKLAAAVNRPARGWPALCTEGKPPSVPPALAAADYAPELARVLTHATIGRAETAAAAVPFVVNDFFAGSGSINAQAARQAGQDWRAGVSFTQGFSTTGNPTLALPLAGGRGLLDGRHLDPVRPLRLGGRAAREELAGRQPGGHPRPAVVHHETDTFITTDTAIDPPHPAGKLAGATLTLDGFSGWPLSAVAS